jgi:methenyltetrahydrofolate cyclohydrolase
MDDSFIDELAKPQPDPGGGAAAAHVAMVALALLKKVCLLEGRRAGNDAAIQAFWDATRLKVEALYGETADLREADCDAYRGLTAARHESADANSISAAILYAVEIPVRIMRTCQLALDIVSEVGGRCAAHLVPDVQVACELFAAAIKGSYHIAEYNVRFVGDPSQRASTLGNLREVLVACEKDVQAVSEHLKNRAVTL